MANLCSFWLIYLMQLLLISFPKAILTKDSIDTQFTFFALEMWGRIEKMSNETVFTDYFYSDPDCIKGISSFLFDNNVSPLENMVQFSGKSLMDFGNQFECEKTGTENEYLFLEIYIDHKTFKEQENFHNLFQFTDQKTFFMGLCLWKNCKPFYEHFFDKESNAPFFSKIKQEFGILGIKYNDDPRLTKHFSVNMIILSCLLCVYVLFRVIVVLIGDVIAYNEDKKAEMELKAVKGEETFNENESEYYLKEDEMSNVKIRPSAENKRSYKMSNRNTPNSNNNSSNSGNSESKIANFDSEPKSINNVSSEITPLPNAFPNKSNSKTKSRKKVEAIFDLDSSSSVNSSHESSLSSHYLATICKHKDEYEKEIKTCVDSIKKKKLNRIPFFFNEDDEDDTEEFDIEVNESYRSSYLLGRASKISKSFFFKRRILSLHKVFSMNESFNLFFNVKNEFYDDSNIELISGLRSYFLFWITLERVIAYFNSLSYDFGNINLYQSFGFGIIKMSTFAVESTIFLDGFAYTYKLMSFIKKENDTSFKTFLKFFFNIIDKFAVFIIMFFVITVYIDEIANLLSKTYIFAYFYRVLKTELCIKSPYVILVPFYLQYYSACREYDFDLCLKYVYHCTNECYCMFFTVVVFYFVYKFKSKAFDKTFALMMMLNTVFCIAYYNLPLNGEGEAPIFYNLKYILGETRIFKQPHILYFVFFMGVNCGLIYYYFIDSIANPEKYLKKKFYYPFSYNFSLMRVFIKISQFKLLSIGLFAFSLQLVICLLYNLLLRIKNEKNNLLIKMDTVTMVIFVYEKKVYILLLAIITMTLLFSSEKLFIKNILKSKFFITFSRISFPFVCLDILVYFFFAFYDTHIYWNYQNILMISFALYGILGVINFTICSLFQLPMRILYKRLLRSG